MKAQSMNMFFAAESTARSSKERRSLGKKEPQESTKNNLKIKHCHKKPTFQFQEGRNIFSKILIFGNFRKGTPFGFCQIL